MTVIPPPTLEGVRLRLRPFTLADIGPRYLGWLNDPEVNVYSQRRDRPPTTESSARAWIADRRPSEHLFAIETKEFGHIGNLKCGPIETLNACADISILIGEREAWGLGYGSEAVDLLTRWLFYDVDLNRVDAGSSNPAFLKLVKKLGWQVEGVLRQRYYLAGKFVDWTIVSKLRGN